jgi:hypothetical protein
MVRPILLAVLVYLAPAARCETLEVIVLDYAGLRGSHAEGAVGIAKTILGGAGLKTRWSVCNAAALERGDCAGPLTSSHLRVLVEKQPLRGLTTPSVLGWANRESAEGDYPTAYAFFGPADELAVETGQPVSVVLGCVIAHEVFHLLGLEHSEQGIMRPRFRPSDIRPLSRGMTLLSSQQMNKARARVSKLLGTQ